MRFRQVANFMEEYCLLITRPRGDPNEHATEKLKANNFL